MMDLSPNQALPQLAKLRRSAKGVLSMIDRIFADQKPVCRQCLYDFGITDGCQCKKS